jgi:hypothetical protein
MSGKDAQKHSFDLWPKIGLAYVRAFQRMVERRNQRGLKTNWKNGEDVMRWWCGWKPPLDKRGGIGEAKGVQREKRHEV